LHESDCTPEEWRMTREGIADADAGRSPTRKSRPSGARATAVHYTIKLLRNSPPQRIGSFCKLERPPSCLRSFRTQAVPLDVPACSPSQFPGPDICSSHPESTAVLDHCYGPPRG
jgi:hypothetical protein